MFTLRIAKLTNEKVSQERDLYKLREELSNADTKSVEQLKVIENQANQIERLKTELNEQTIELNNSKMASDQLVLCKLVRLINCIHFNITVIISIQ